MEIQNIYQRYKKIVGWGTGSLFDVCQNIVPIRVDFLVDGNCQKWDSVHHGISVYQPSVLKDENSLDTLVIVYSSYYVEIVKELSEIGNFDSVYAGDIYNFEYKAMEKKFNRYADKTVKRPVYRNQTAIVIQGPIVPKVTERIVRFYAYQFPFSFIVVSTWSCQNAESIREIINSVDAYIENEKPTFGGGVGNRNYQIVTTKSGVDKAIDLGAMRILKTRSDMAIVGDDILNRCDDVLLRHWRKSGGSYGIQNRILIPTSFTNKYRLYHPSDMVMYGDAHDLKTYWDAPLDPRDRTHSDFSNLENQSLVDASCQSKAFTESYLGTSFCERIGREVKGTLEDSWDFYQEFFVVQDDKWFEMMWTKHRFVSGSVSNENVDHHFWLDLEVNREGLEVQKKNVDQMFCNAYMIPS